MQNKSKVIIVLDSLKYIEKEDKLKDSISQNCEPEFYYTYYENSLIRFFHRLHVLGNFLSHVAYWAISFLAASKIFLTKGKFENKVFINPIVAIFYCFLLRFSTKKEKIIIAGFLFEDKKNKIYFYLRKAFVNFCYLKVSKIIVYSRNEITLYSEWFPKLAEKFIFIKYGRDFDVFEEKKFESNEAYFASGGVSNRDFKTLVNALKILEIKFPALKCKIATRPQACGSHDEIKTLTVHYNIRIDTFGSFLSGSLFVVIPLANTFLSAGHMALLEAMYRGKSILITDIRAVRDYVDDDLVSFYNPEDEIDLADKIESLYLNLNTDEIINKEVRVKAFYEKHYTFAALLGRITDESVLGM